VVVGMLQMKDYQMHVLFDSGATHSFIANKNVTKLSKETKRVEKGFIIGTPLGETMKTNVVFEGVGININGCELEVDLIPLELSDFDIILGMNWLGKNKARLDCFTKTVTF
jgi:predicted aspartyl protease